MKSCLINDYLQYTIYEDGTILNHETFQILSATITRQKVVVSLTNNKKSKLFAYSRLVAEHFIENPENKKIVRHIDGDFTNYHKDNLKWCNQGEWNIKFDNEEDRQKKRKEVVQKSRDKHRDERLIKEKEWRKTERGNFIRNKNHWIASKMREPDEGWESFYFDTFLKTTKCQLCDIKFDPDKDYNSQRCLDHDHHSGYKRFICCRKCNTVPIRNFDRLRERCIIELHRYFRLYT